MTTTRSTGGIYYFYHMLRQRVNAARKLTDQVIGVAITLKGYFNPSKTDDMSEQHEDKCNFLCGNIRR